MGKLTVWWLFCVIGAGVAPCLCAGEVDVKLLPEICNELSTFDRKTNVFLDDFEPFSVLMDQLKRVVVGLEHEILCNKKISASTKNRLLRSSLAPLQTALSFALQALLRIHREGKFPPIRIDKFLDGLYHEAGPIAQSNDPRKISEERAEFARRVRTIQERYISVKNSGSKLLGEATTYLERARASLQPRRGPWSAVASGFSQLTAAGKAEKMLVDQLKDATEALGTMVIKMRQDFSTLFLSLGNLAYLRK